MVWFGSASFFIAFSEPFRFPFITCFVSFCFTSFRCKVLVTTDACSEGIDVPECNLVVSMDKIKTSRTLIHTRGRARSKGGKFVVMLEARPKEVPELVWCIHLVHTHSHLSVFVCSFLCVFVPVFLCFCVFRVCLIVCIVCLCLPFFPPRFFFFLQGRRAHHTGCKADCRPIWSSSPLTCCHKGCDVFLTSAVSSTKLVDRSTLPKE